MRKAIAYCFDSKSRQNGIFVLVGQHNLHNLETNQAVANALAHLESHVSLMNAYVLTCSPVWLFVGEIARGLRVCYKVVGSWKHINTCQCKISGRHSRAVYENINKPPNGEDWTARTTAWTFYKSQVVKHFQVQLSLHLLEQNFGFLTQTLLCNYSWI